MRQTVFALIRLPPPSEQRGVEGRCQSYVVGTTTAKSQAPWISSVLNDRLVGLVVKASDSRAEDPGFESRLPRDFFGVESYQ